MQISLDAKTIKKQQAYDLVCRLKNSEALTAAEIDSLLLYFAPPVPTKPKTAMQWVARACAKRDVRYYLCFIHVADGVMVATDGHRLHYAPTALDDGYYCPKTFAKLDEAPGKYPDWRRTLPTGASEYVGRIAEAERYNDNRLYRYVLGNREVNGSYLDDALAGFDCDIELYPVSRTAIFCGAHEFGSFLVMGMNQKKEEA